LAFITNNSFLDGLIHRQMRKSLLECFDKIYILDLHGNAKKKETAPDGSIDQNVFDIMQGVSINIFVKTRKKDHSSLADLNLFDLRGTRKDKYLQLAGSNLYSIAWEKIILDPGNLMFKNFTSEIKLEYSQHFKISEMFPFVTSGVKTHNDEKLVASSRQRLLAQNSDLGYEFDDLKIKKYAYRPFDNGYVYYDNSLIGRAREKTIYHLDQIDNLGLILVAQAQAANLDYFDCVYIVNRIQDTNMFRRGGPLAFPIYLYPHSSSTFMILHEPEIRKPNINKQLVKTFGLKIGLEFTNEKEKNSLTFAPIDILDYIYAVLHSPAYREKYKEFLKIDFPRVPYPAQASAQPSPKEREQSQERFWKLVDLGSQIRQIHLLESPEVNNFITSYPVDGDNKVGKVLYENGRVFINYDKAHLETGVLQYFDGVPQTAWNFFIGGYQPAQKWLKDRKERTLAFEDILHYQKIIKALTETDRLMKEVDAVGVES